MSSLDIFELHSADGFLMIEISTLPNRKRFQAARQDDGGICPGAGHSNSDEFSALSSCCDSADLKQSTGSIIHLLQSAKNHCQLVCLRSGNWRSGLMRCFSLIAVLLSGSGGCWAPSILKTEHRSLIASDLAVHMHS